MVNIEKKRITFASVAKQVEYPDFLDIQMKSFKEFFQLDAKPEDRKNEGLFKAFTENFPISDARNSFVLEFKGYSIDSPRYSIEECIERGLTYSVPLKAKLKLYCTDPEHEDFETVYQDVYLGTCPYMTPSGSFIFNGSERVIVSQLHRSPGVFFGQSHHANGTKLYSARIIPFKGSWIEFATDINNVMYAYIDRKKKLPMTTLLRAIGYERDKDILEIFDLSEEIEIKGNDKNIINRTLAARVLKIWHEDFVDEDTGEVLSVEKNEILIERDILLKEEHIDLLVNHEIKTVLLHKEGERKKDYSIIYNTLHKDPTNSEKEAVEYIYRQLRNTEPPDEETARGVIDKLFFSDARYSLGPVGRYRLNKRLGLNIDPDYLVLTKEDIIAIIEHLNALFNSKREVDDIDHLSNRRVRTVGEQLYTQFSIGLARMARTIRERMNVRDNEVFMPVDLINAKTLSSVINTFFGTNQLSQFMDQTNPLSEITHKRRLSALGPGGLSRERAGFEVRDVNYSHYGRLCPIETPEGPNIGLISSLSVFAKINNMGFVETPYRIVYNQKVDLKSEVKYLSAEEEEGRIIAQANAIDKYGNFLSDRIISREDGDFPIVKSSQVDYIDVAPNQIASISASLIPFLEHDDANRALMGSNMMRQAVPLLKPDAPIVGTGLEEQVARDSRILINAKKNGFVEYVDANRIIVRYERTDKENLVSFDPVVQVYNLVKFRKTNQNTCITLKPIVKRGMKVVKGQILCEGYATENGELALGKNLKAAFIPCNGYNFEDAVLISEKVVSEDWFTSIHIDEYSLDVRDTKLGMEELTNDIPNVSEEATKDLDENGIVRVGAEVKPGDILIGKITPKGESDPTPEEKLLRAIFGDKAGNVKDASLRAEPSLFGVVIDTKLFTRSIKDKTSRAQDKIKIVRLEKEYEKKFLNVKNLLVKKLQSILNGRLCHNSIFNDQKQEIVKKGVKFTTKILNNIQNYVEIYSSDWTDDIQVNSLISEILHNYKITISDLNSAFKHKKFSITVGDELPSGIVKMAKVYIAKKRKLKVGDKMAGRHGNKGVVARILREEDMPFLEDGSPVDIVLNPLGVPSRMNIGQIYETVLGWAGYKLNMKFSTPIFDGATIEEICEYTDKAKIPRFGTTYLFDGGTGERFDQPATVGVIYMLKLGHMVDDKMHARSIGPYSLITQQPLGGKAQFGGQRFGEMEVWALEAFGASNLLREILTVKSDDVVGRAKTYESIVKGEPMPEPNNPESFNVLCYELKGLGLDIRLEE
ncbi:DNA-directed RNA polymerase subunit beta [Blattabacterium sp. (Nauphoeta cinerea)]|uniref:DNA-directed RNA polymerase subunit beta n=1 Tax=Blattabacterium sp. (Nauphoeta cinerea) TaxID=1316444 RepID=UPI0003B04C19|nr:DNA-directed RNA polymerase subunit beta [Blattabacterium sp. (Nauphoeta cinerea)]AGW85949.1 DNA-directed RNA polymerase subunit beta [Blattabacterium sp. (Nauphoeta cinerea)]